MFLSRSDEEINVNRRLAKDLVDKWVSIRYYLTLAPSLSCIFFSKLSNSLRFIQCLNDREENSGGIFFVLCLALSCVLYNYLKWLTHEDIILCVLSFHEFIISKILCLCHLFCDFRADLYSIRVLGLKTCEILRMIEFLTGGHRLKSMLVHFYF